MKLYGQVLRSTVRKTVTEWNVTVGPKRLELLHEVIPAGDHHRAAGAAIGISASLASSSSPPSCGNT